MSAQGKSIAPAIYGHQDIKKALACALFAGSQKRLRDGMRAHHNTTIPLWIGRCQSFLQKPSIALAKGRLAVGNGFP